MIDILILVILAILATYRLARLLSRDTILEGLRRSIYRKASNPASGWYFIAELVKCPHCLGVWIAFFTVIILSLYFHWMLLEGVLIWLAVAGGQSFLQSIVDMNSVEDEEEQVTNADSQ